VLRDPPRDKQEDADRQPLHAGPSEEEIESQFNRCLPFGRAYRPKMSTLFGVADGSFRTVAFRDAVPINGFYKQV
jgi:hypothetical protein